MKPKVPDRECLCNFPVPRVRHILFERRGCKVTLVPDFFVKSWLPSCRCHGRCVLLFGGNRQESDILRKRTCSPARFTVLYWFSLKIFETKTPTDLVKLFERRFLDQTPAEIAMVQISLLRTQERGHQTCLRAILSHWVSSLVTTI